MALSRLCLRNSLPLLHESVGLLSSSSSRCSSLLHVRYAPPALLSPLRREFPFRGFAAARPTSPASSAQTEDKKAAGATHQEITVSEESENSPRRKRADEGGARGRSLWRNPRDLVPFGGGLLTPSGIGNALWQTTENINRLLRNLSPSHFFRRMKEGDSSYRLQFEVPGLSKDDIRVTVEDNFLVITGEKKEEEEGGGSDEDDYWSSRSYGYYNTSLMLPEDAKVDEIRAEVKHGMLYVTIPRTGERKRDVRDVEVH